MKKQGLSATDQYNDIIHTEYPFPSAHPKMARADRAAQFSAFAALTGYDEAVKETARQTQHWETPDEVQLEQLNKQIKWLSRHIAEEPFVKVRYFVPDDRKEGGSWQILEGQAVKLDLYERTLTIRQPEQVSESQGEVTAQRYIELDQVTEILI